MKVCVTRLSSSSLLHLCPLSHTRHHFPIRCTLVTHRCVAYLFSWLLHGLCRIVTCYPILLFSSTSSLPVSIVPPTSSRCPLVTSLLCRASSCPSPSLASAPSVPASLRTHSWMPWRWTTTRRGSRSKSGSDHEREGDLVGPPGWKACG